jgi:hypothetical protein
MAQKPRELRTPIDPVSRSAPSPRPGTGQGVGGRKALAEFLGTALLVTAIVGSGIAAQRLSPGDVGLKLLETTLVIAAALAAIILAVGPVSGGHLNPVTTLVDRFFGGASSQDAPVYGVAQFAGIAPGSTAPVMGFELIGGAVGACCIAALYPKVRPGAQDAAIPQPEAR